MAREKHPLLRKRTITTRVSEWVLEAVKGTQEETFVDRSNMIEESLIKVNKYKKPSPARLKKYLEENK